MKQRLGLPMSLYYRLKLWKAMRRMVSDVSETVWPDVMRKKANCSKTELSEYTQVRAAQLVHPKVDALLKQYPRISGAVGTQLLAAASRGVELQIRRKTLKAGGIR